MELVAAKPALMAAQEAVNCLDKPSLTELKSFSKVRASHVANLSKCHPVNSQCVPQITSYSSGAELYELVVPKSNNYFVAALDIE